MDPDAQAVQDAAELQALRDYELSTPANTQSFGETLGIPAPQSRQPQDISDAQILKAMGKGASYLETSAWQYDRDNYRKQHLDAQKAMATAQAGEYRTYIGALGKQQERADKMATAQAAKMDPSYIAQQVYSRAGSLGGARTIAKSTGSALLNHGQVVDMGRAGSYAIIPQGEVSELQLDGSSKRVSMTRHIQKMGVSVVPFLGGDEAATAWRGATAKASELMTMLDQIEDIYEKAPTVSFRTSEANRALLQLEQKLAPIVSQIMSGSKSMAGTSDLEMKAIMDTLPRAGTDYTMTVGTGLKNVKLTREQVRGVIIRTALMNGVVLTPLRAKAEITAGSTTGQQSSSPNIPPGTNNGRK